jgi:hypothetical protein
MGNCLSVGMSSSESEPSGDWQNTHKLTRRIAARCQRDTAGDGDRRIRQRLIIAFRLADTAGLPDTTILGIDGAGVALVSLIS